MKKIIYIFCGIIIIFFIINFSNIKTNIETNSKVSIVNNNNNFIINKEIMSKLKIEPYNPDREQIEYIITKEYIYSEDWDLLDTNYSLEGFVNEYDENWNLINKKPLTVFLAKRGFLFIVSAVNS